MTERLIMRHKQDILHRQLVVERLAEMAMELYARTTTIARTQGCSSRMEEEAHTRELALTDLFCVSRGCGSGTHGTD